MLEIGMICAEAGEKKTGWLEIEGGGQKLPLTLICGAKEGPTMMISAGVHGAEYIGVQALSELSRELDPKDTAGECDLPSCGKSFSIPGLCALFRA